MKKIGFIVLGSLVVLVITLGIFYYKYFRGVGPAIKDPVGNIADMLDVYNTPRTTSTVDVSGGLPDSKSTVMPLKLPSEFSISIFAKNLPGVRVMNIDPRGDMWVSRTNEGAVTLLDIEGGNIVEQHDIFTSLQKPHGLVFDESTLYIAEENKISIFEYYLARKTPGEVLGTATSGTAYDRVQMSKALSSQRNALSRIIDLPKGGRHSTRTLGFGSDGKLYVSIGSTCDTCNEKDPRHAAIYSLDTSNLFSLEGRTRQLKLFANGLRNSVFFAWHPETKKMWATEMGRDFLGDDLPPEEINIIEEGKHYGWPECYGKNIPDHEFDSKVSVSVCKEPDRISSYIDLPAHSAPLGLAFVPPDSSWPKEYWYNLLVAYHGSWNKSKPDGYKIVRIKLDKQGDYIGTEDFITGWLTPKGALGRPVDILIQKNGTMYVSDDKAGVIYRILVKS